MRNSFTPTEATSEVYSCLPLVISPSNTKIAIPTRHPSDHCVYIKSWTCSTCPPWKLHCQQIINRVGIVPLRSGTRDPGLWSRDHIKVRLWLIRLGLSLLVAGVRLVAREVFDRKGLKL